VRELARHQILWRNPGSRLLRAELGEAQERSDGAKDDQAALRIGGQRGGDAEGTGRVDRAVMGNEDAPKRYAMAVVLSRMAASQNVVDAESSAKAFGKCFLACRRAGISRSVRRTTRRRRDWGERLAPVSE
jgi:hypothetical protein